MTGRYVMWTHLKWITKCNKSKWAGWLYELIVFNYFFIANLIIIV